MGLGAVHHIALTVTDLNRSRTFYEPIFSFLGYTNTHNFPGFDIWESQSTGVELTIWQAKPELVNHKQYDYAPGLHHLAFYADSREQVDAFYQLLLDIHANVVDPPAEYDYIPGYYAVFFRDPDDIRIELVHIPNINVE